MPSKPIPPASSLRIAARVATIVLGSVAMAAPGCSDSSLPKDTVTGTPAGASLAPEGKNKPNASSSKPPAKAEPL